MNKTITLLLLAVSHVCFAQQTILTNSNLPIIIIETDIDPATGMHYEIPDDVKAPATMKLICRPDGSRNNVSDSSNTAFLNYNGKIGIELRGSSSQALSKKPYGFSTRSNDNATCKNVSLLDMPSDNDWVLNALAFDPSMIRDYLSYHLARSMGNYAPRTRFVEVIIDDDYKGVYILMEKIKIDKGRIDLTKPSPEDNELPDITGGYIVKADKTTGGDEVAWTMPSYAQTTNYLYDCPKPEAISAQQSEYIQNVFAQLAAATNPSNPSIVNGYPSIIDVPSFIDFIILAELSANVDAYQLSTYFHKDKNGKLRAGPVWDYNLTFGNDLLMWGLDRSWTDVWQLDNYDNTGSQFWKDLFDDATFRCYLAKRWSQLTAANQPLSYKAIESQINSYQALLAESKAREQERWGTVADQETNITDMKTWIQSRITWMSANIGSSGNCTAAVPHLVISKIHYNPLATDTYQSKDLEFIEITNHSDKAVDLTGYYIRELGISYQFPAKASVAPHQKVCICSDSTDFAAFYGYKPFDQYTRSLDNDSYHIVLSDAFGTIIDEVRYQDAAPWPTGADGKGPWLELIDLDKDNSVATNWTTGQQTVTADGAPVSQALNVYPNPTKDMVHVSLNGSAPRRLEVTVANALGETVGTYTFFSNTFDIDLSTYSAGFYFFSIKTNERDVLHGNVCKE